MEISMNYGKAGIEKRNASRKSKKVRRKIGFTILRLVLLSLVVLLVAGGVFAFRTLQDIIAQAPDISNVAVSPTEAATYIYNQEGQRVQKLTLPEANRDLVTLDRVPVQLQHAVVAVEDERFYQHKGIDPKGILRAAWIGITSGHFSEGASTITQQLLKNSVFPGWTSEVTFQDRLVRKIQEQYLALQLEKEMSKEQILEDYLNIINLGAGCYGVQAAAYRYFGKDVSELTLSECTVIAGITQNPTAYNPILYPEKNAARRKTVLNNMLEQGYITQAEYDQALADDVYSRIHSNEENTDSTASIYTYYQDALIDQVLNDLMEEKGYTYKQAFKAVYTGGLRIFSAQDDAIQAICEEEFDRADNFPSGTEVGIDYALSIENPEGEITNYGNEELRSYVRRNGNPSFDLMYSTREEAQASADAFRASVLKEGDTVLGERITITPQPQASVTVIDQSTGYIKAIVGGRGSKDASLTLNRSSYTKRQPGSTFKILTTYAPALDACGKTLATLFDNEEYAYEDGTKVSNWDLNHYTGPTTIREAIIRSINIVAVKCITEITPQLGFNYARALGITSLHESYDTGTEILTDIIQPLALGGITEGVTNLELCGAYAAIANLGQYIKPKFYTQVLDQYGNVVLDNTHPAASTAMKASTAYLLTDAMKEVISNPQGTAYGQINLGMMPVAGKTGTTSDYKDIWFAGYTPYYTCCVWGGYDNNDALPSDGIYHTYNKVLWTAIMSRIHEGLPISSFHTPDDIVTVSICRSSGLAAIPGVCSSYEEKFALGTQPAQYCTIHGSGAPLETPQRETGGSDIAPGAITIYNSDQTVIYPDVLEDVGLGDSSSGAEGSGNTSGTGNAPSGGSSGADAGWTGDAATGSDPAGNSSGADMGVPDSSGGNSSGMGPGIAGGTDGNTSGTGSGVSDTSGGSSSGSTGQSGGDIMILEDDFGSLGEDTLTREQLEILNQIPEALP